MTPDPNQRLDVLALRFALDVSEQAYDRAVEELTRPRRGRSLLRLDAAVERYRLAAVSRARLEYERAFARWNRAAAEVTGTRWLHVVRDL